MQCDINYQSLSSGNYLKWKTSHRIKKKKNLLGKTYYSVLQPVKFIRRKSRLYFFCPRPHFAEHFCLDTGSHIFYSHVRKKGSLCVGKRQNKTKKPKPKDTKKKKKEKKKKK